MVVVSSSARGPLTGEAFDRKPLEAVGTTGETCRLRYRLVAAVECRIGTTLEALHVAGRIR